MRILTTLKRYPATIISLILLISGISAIFIEGKVYAQEKSKKSYCDCVPTTCNPEQELYCADASVVGHEDIHPVDPLTGCVCKGLKRYCVYERDYKEECEKVEQTPLLGCCDNDKGDCGRWCAESCGNQYCFVADPDNPCPESTTTMCTGKCKYNRE